MPRRFDRRLFRSFPTTLAVALPVLAVLVVLGFDWWTCLPEGRRAEEYVGIGKCAECHPDEIDHWTGSDHDLAMDVATARTVLGDFENAQFTQIAFDQVLLLNDDEIRAAVEVVAPRLWAVALQDPTEAYGKDLADKLRAKISQAMSESGRAELAELTERRKAMAPLRPCDVTDAQREIGDILRRLKKDGKIAADFAVTSTMFRRNGKFFVGTDNGDGRMEDFEVKYVFGVRPLQQYLVEFPDGRVQCLPIAWDTENQSWYHLYCKEPIPFDDPLHWTGPLQNWNYMCAECHTTNLRKNYKLEENAYHTTWSEIDVSCETCHGPGSLHVELAESGGIFWDRRYRYGLPELNEDQPRKVIENCAPCHSRRRIVHPDVTPGGKFLDSYLPEVLDRELYYADGQILDEDYVYGSFIQSRMYDEGVSCIDCHDPHTAKVKFTDNRLCCQCHLSATYDALSHHHHPDESQPGTLCVECHMPETKYMVVDPRRDHSLRIPRPDLTVGLQIPNACNGCHDDFGKGETPEWAVETVKQWYGEPKEPLHFAYGIAAGRELKPAGDKQLAAMARHKELRGAIRASAIALLSGYRSGGGEAAAVAGLEDPDELIRAVSVRSLEYLEPDQLHRRLTPMLDDPVRAVRTEAARLLTRIPLRAFSSKERAAFDRGLEEYMEGQECVGDQAAAHLNMAVIHTNLAEDEVNRARQAYQQEIRLDSGATEKARDRYHKAVRQATEKAFQEYQRALRIDPRFVPAKINLAMLHDQRGEKREAERQFREVLQIDPELAEIHYSLGLLLAEDESQLAEAAESLAAAAELSPENPRIHYNLGLAYQTLGRATDAEKELKQALRLAASDPTDCLTALAILYSQQKHFKEAALYADKLIRLQPGNPRWKQFRANLLRESEAGDQER